MRSRLPGVALTLTALLCACASNGPPQKTRQDLAYERYLAYAGPSIPSFWWPGRLYSWEALGRNHLAVFTTPGDAYLLTVWPNCDMRFVINAIGITSTTSTVNAHLDSIMLNSSGTGPGRWSCPIDEIRKIDYARYRADLKAGRAPPPIPPPDASPAAAAPPPAGATPQP
jgi:hypothetical protein